MPKFQVDIWFDQKPQRRMLGSVIIEAPNEPRALIEAELRTEHWVIGEMGSERVLERIAV